MKQGYVSTIWQMNFHPVMMEIFGRLTISETDLRDQDHQQEVGTLIPNTRKAYKRLPDISDLWNNRVNDQAEDQTTIQTDDPAASSVPLDNTRVDRAYRTETINHRITNGEPRNHGRPKTDERVINGEGVRIIKARTTEDNQFLKRKFFSSTNQAYGKRHKVLCHNTWQIV